MVEWEGYIVLLFFGFVIRGNVFCFESLVFLVK